MTELQPHQYIEDGTSAGWSPNTSSVSARTASVSASRAIKNNKQALNWLGGGDRNKIEEYPND